MLHLLWVVVVVLVVFWLLGLMFRVAGQVIHLLLVAALILIVFNIIMRV